MWDLVQMLWPRDVHTNRLNTMHTADVMDDYYLMQLHIVQLLIQATLGYSVRAVDLKILRSAAFKKERKKKNMLD